MIADRLAKSEILANATISTPEPMMMRATTPTSHSDNPPNRPDHRNLPPEHDEAENKSDHSSTINGEQLQVDVPADTCRFSGYCATSCD